jgi:hypothetical protein
LPFSFGCGGFVARHSGLGVIEKGLWPLNIWAMLHIRPNKQV